MRKQVKEYLKRIPESFQDTYKKGRSKKSRKLAIYAFCAQCMGYETSPKDCCAIGCPLYAYRGWKRTQNVTEERKEALRERAKVMRKKGKKNAKE